MGSDQDPQPCEPYPHGPKGPCSPSAPAPWQGPINQLVAIQRNRVMNNGGIAVRGHTANVLVEANQVLNSSVSVAVNHTHASHVLVEHNGAVELLELEVLEERAEAAVMVDVGSDVSWGD